MVSFPADYSNHDIIFNFGRPGAVRCMILQTTPPPTAQMAPKLTRNSKAVQLLIAKFRSGELSGRETPKNVYESNPLFKSHKLAAFRTRYNVLRKEFAREQVKTEHTEETYGNGLNTRCSEEEKKLTPKKRRLIERDVELSSEDGNSEDDICRVESELFQHGRTFKPLYLLSEWTEPGTMAKQISAAIVLPSGIDSGGFSLRVADGGESIELKVLWPRTLVDMAVLHRKWLNSESGNFKTYHPKIVGFENALKQLCGSCTDSVESVARILLPFSVQPDIDRKHNLAWREWSTRMLYLDLKAVVDNYAITRDSDEFEVV